MPFKIFNYLILLLVIFQGFSSSVWTVVEGGSTSESGSDAIQMRSSSTGSGSIAVDNDKQDGAYNQNQTPESSHSMKPPPPGLWETGLVEEVCGYLNCDLYDDFDPANYVTLEPYKRIIPTEDTWNLLRDIYRKVIMESPTTAAKRKKRYFTNDKIFPKHFNVNGTKSAPYYRSNGFHINVSIIWTEYGRGLQVEQDVNEPGTLIWTSNYSAMFETGQDYRTFIKETLNHPKGGRNLACDVCHWSYTRLYLDKKVICTDLDIGSLSNQCDTEEQCLMEIVTGRYTGCRTQFQSRYKIRKGDELRFDISYFAEDLWHDIMSTS